MRTMYVFIIGNAFVNSSRPVPSEIPNDGYDVRVSTETHRCFSFPGLLNASAVCCMREFISFFLTVS